MNFEFFTNDLDLSRIVFSYSSCEWQYCLVWGVQNLCEKRDGALRLSHDGYSSVMEVKIYSYKVGRSIAQTSNTDHR